MRLFLTGLVMLTLGACNLLQSPKEEFWGRLKPLCGHVFAGELVSDDEQDQEFKKADLAASFRSCPESDRIDIDFMVNGEPYSHWVLTRSNGKYELRHIHKDGVTGYGGFAADNSSGSRMNFPADDITKALFDEAGIPVSKTNVWALEARSGSVFRYELSRPGRLFQVEFNTTQPHDPSAPDE